MKVTEFTKCLLLCVFMIIDVLFPNHKVQSCLCTFRSALNKLFKYHLGIPMNAWRFIYHRCTCSPGMQHRMQIDRPIYKRQSFQKVPLSLETVDSFCLAQRIKIRPLNSYIKYFIYSQFNMYNDLVLKDIFKRASSP